MPKLKTLDAAETKLLEELEKKADDAIFESARSLLKFAGYLREIRDQRLYRPATWEDYCEQRFKLRAESVNRYIRALEVSDTIESRIPGLLQPEYESQTRPLQQLPAPMQAAAWQLASTHGQPTQAQVRTAAEIVQVRPGQGVMLREPPPHMLSTDVWTVLDIELEADRPIRLQVTLGGEPIWQPLSNIAGVIDPIPEPAELEQSLEEVEPPVVDRRLSWYLDPEPEPEPKPESEPKPEPVRNGYLLHNPDPSDEHYSPPHLVKVFLDLWGYIDLDPAADPLKKIVPAKRHYSKSDNGLLKTNSWQADNIYLNPPYSSQGESSILDWMTRLHHELRYGQVAEAGGLLPVYPDTAWWRELELMGAVFCFLKSRTRFLGLDGAPQPHGARFPTCLFYVGERIGDFYDLAAPYGVIYQELPRDFLGDD